MRSSCGHFRPEQITYSGSVWAGGAALAIYFSKKAKNNFRCKESSLESCSSKDKDRYYYATVSINLNSFILESIKQKKLF